MDKLDQLHVVSDLHLGGIPGHQIFNQGQALAAVIDHLRAAPAGQQVGLVLNGDIVDFLAAADAKHFDPVGAPAKLQAIMSDPAFAPVFDALARFAATDDRVLVLVLGNHDVELALPSVQDLLLTRICADSDAARGRVRVAMDGTGYACLVGGRRVLCVHGNEADPWNVVDHDALRDYIKAENEGAPAKEPTANAGTRLVVDVMNAIKATYPFVDLLKPETVPVPGVLLALPAHLHAPLLDFARITLRLAYDKARTETGFLGGEAGPPPPPPPAEGYRALDLLIRGSTPRPEPSLDVAQARSEAWLTQAAGDFQARRRPLDVLGLEQGSDMLGLGGLLWDKLTGKDTRDNLREALRVYLAGDSTFNFDTRDAVYQQHDGSVGPDVQFLVTGHTHLERRIPRARGGGVYFNSGTWIRLVRVREDQLDTPTAFEPIFQAISSGRLADLDTQPGLVLQRRTVVSIWSDQGAVYGELRNAVSAEEAAAAPGQPPWRPVVGTRYPSFVPARSV
jgi:UDP-2,3-diacylglucosamine pyrophosphatase LpxH